MWGREEELAQARSCHADTVALMSFLLSGIWPGVDTGDIDGSDDLCPQQRRLHRWEGRRAVEDPIEVTYLSPLSPSGT